MLTSRDASWIGETALHICIPALLIIKCYKLKVHEVFVAGKQRVFTTKFLHAFPRPTPAHASEVVISGTFSSPGTEHASRWEWRWLHKDCWRSHLGRSAHSQAGASLTGNALKRPLGSAPSGRSDRSSSWMGMRDFLAPCLLLDCCLSYCQERECRFDTPVLRVGPTLSSA